MQFPVQSIGTVSDSRLDPIDDNWEGQEVTITLDDRFGEEALFGLDDFSHVEVIYLFHKVPPDSIHSGARRPRNNPAWPEVGIFAQRGKNRPNRLGSTICRVVRVSGRNLIVAELDAIAGTPVLDLKPVMLEFLPREEIHQPDWSHELMQQYWATPHDIGGT